MSDLLRKVNAGGPLAEVRPDAADVRYLGDPSRAPVMATPAIGVVATAAAGEAVTAGVGEGENLGVSEETQSVVDEYNEKHPVGEE